MDPLNGIGQFIAQAVQKLQDHAAVGNTMPNSVMPFQPNLQYGQPTQAAPPNLQYAQPLPDPFAGANKPAHILEQEYNQNRKAFQDWTVKQQKDTAGAAAQETKNKQSEWQDLLKEQKKALEQAQKDREDFYKQGEGLQKSLQDWSTNHPHAKAQKLSTWQILGPALIGMLANLDPSVRRTGLGNQLAGNMVGSQTQEYQQNADVLNQQNEAQRQAALQALQWHMANRGGVESRANNAQDNLTELQKFFIGKEMDQASIDAKLKGDPDTIIANAFQDWRDGKMSEDSLKALVIGLKGKDPYTKAALDAALAGKAGAETRFIAGPKTDLANANEIKALAQADLYFSEKGLKDYDLSFKKLTEPDQVKLLKSKWGLNDASAKYLAKKTQWVGKDTMAEMIRASAYADQVKAGKQLSAKDLVGFATSLSALQQKKDAAEIEASQYEEMVSQGVDAMGKPLDEGGKTVYNIAAAAKRREAQSIQAHIDTVSDSQKEAQGKPNPFAGASGEVGSPKAPAP